MSNLLNNIEISSDITDEENTQFINNLQHDTSKLKDSDYVSEKSDFKISHHEKNRDNKSSISRESHCELNHSNVSDVIFNIGDGIFASVIVAPLVVAVWRGTWELMDIYSDYFPFAQSYVLGIMIHVSFALIRSQLLSRSADAWSGGAGIWLCERLLSRIYFYVFLWSCILHWRGGWGLFDATINAILPNEKDPHRPFLILAFMAFFYACLASLRTARNMLAPPYFLVTDGKEPTYIFTTRFRKSNSRETMLYILDCIFSVAVVGSLVVLLWRGLWALLDIYLYPEELVKSYCISMVVGYTLVVVTFALQAPLCWAAARLHGAARLLLADTYHLLSFIATINLWRAVWGLLDVYFFPESPKLSNWLSHGASLGLLMLLNCSNSVLVRGVYIDAEEPAGECVVFPCHYLRLFFYKERTKKRHRRVLAAAAAASKRQSEDPALIPLQLSIFQEKV